MVALALSAGMLAAVSPCGFALLPAYLSVLVAADRDGGRRATAAAVGRALRCTAALTVVYVAVFSAFGLVLAPVSGWLQLRLPWFTLAVGAGLALAGVWLAGGRTLPAWGVGLRAPRLTGSATSMVLFGMAYAIASIGCAAGPFLAIVVAGLRAGSLGEGVLLFAAYAAGVGLMIGVTAVALALVRVSVVARLRRVSALAPRLGGGVLAAAGAYLAYYGWYELRVTGDRRVAGTDPVVNAAGDLQRWISALVDRTGPGWLLVVLAAGVLAGLAAGWWAARRTAAHQTASP